MLNLKISTSTSQVLWFCSRLNFLPDKLRSGTVMLSFATNTICRHRTWKWLRERHCSRRRDANQLCICTWLDYLARERIAGGQMDFLQSARKRLTLSFLSVFFSQIITFVHVSCHFESIHRLHMHSGGKCQPRRPQCWDGWRLLDRRNDCQTRASPQRVRHPPSRRLQLLRQLSHREVFCTWRCQSRCARKGFFQCYLDIV